ncbi:MAG: hypothetical protein ACXABF_08715 [Candidatus Thorarchaeota archaeon]|jgi:hypothetical protein
MMAITPKVSPIPSNVPTFAYEFVARMREVATIHTKPSVRQTQAIPQLLSARYFKVGQLSLDDFIDAAVYTTYPPDQELARKIAEDILLGRNETSKLEDQAAQAAAEAATTVKKSDDALERVMQQIKWERELAETIQRDKVEAGFEYLQSLRSKEDKELYNAAMDYMNEGDIVLRGLTSDKELAENAASALRERMGGLSSKDIQNSQTLGTLDEMCQAPNAAEQLAAKALRGDKGLEQSFADLAERDPMTAARALKHMEEMGKPSKSVQRRMDKKLQSSLKDLSQAAEYASQLKRPPSNLPQKIKDAPTQFQLDDSSQFAKSIKEHSKKHSHEHSQQTTKPQTKKDIMDQLLEEYNKQYNTGASEKVDMRQLADSAQNLQSWKDLVDKETKSTIEKADSRSSPSDYLRQQVRDNQAIKERLKDGAAKTTWDDSLEQMANAAVKKSPTKTHLRKTVRELNRLRAPPSQEAAREAGQKLGMSEDEILEMLTPTFKVIKNLIQQGLADFDRLESLISSAGLSKSQLKELADAAVERGNQVALGAVAHQDLNAALGTTSGSGTQGGKPDPKRSEMVMGGLLGGPATNVIKIWYNYRDHLPPELKAKLRDIARRLLVDLGMRFARQTMGSSMLGGIQQSTTVRPFRIGDDIDLIDLEETIDRLLSEGRSSFKSLKSDDFLITETYQGHRAFFWALDKSGSMNSAEKLGMLAISVMAGLYGVQKDDFGVLLFDHQTHIVKEIADRSVSIDKVATDLLDVRAGGGTGGRTSMRQALKNFEDTRAKEKIFLFNTDAYLSDQAECVKLAEEMKQKDIKLIVLVPRSSYNASAADQLAKANHGVVADIGSVEELPERLLRLTNY